MKQINFKKLLIPNLPYVLIGLYASKIGQAYRLAAGADFSEKLRHIGEGFAAAFVSPYPSFYLTDLAIGLCCGAALRLAVYVRGRTPRNTGKTWSMALPGGEPPQTSSLSLTRYLRTTLY